MEKIRFGKTELMVSKVAMGGIPIMRLNMAGAVKVINHAFDAGINFIDTANMYGDSEEKIGKAIRGLPRHDLVIASKSGAFDKDGFNEHLELSLQRLGTDYIDIYQHHNVATPEAMERVLGPNGAFEAMTAAVAGGKIRHPAFSSHHLSTAKAMMETGKYSAVQFPFNFVDDDAQETLIPLAEKLNMGFIAMKPLGGGLLENARLCFTFLNQFGSIVPDPGIEKIEEIDEIAAIINSGATLTKTDLEEINTIKNELGDSWCHRCDYCQPCPQDIKISMVLNTRSMVKRLDDSSVRSFLGGLIEKSEDCTECRVCVERCPYDLEVPELMKSQRAFWESYVQGE
jgi:uncharacterized protein